MSDPASPARRLAAVMFLDMAGYSALMSKSESEALDCVKELELLLRAEIPSAGGRLVKFMGDGSMAEFQTAGAAVACARKIQERIAARNAEAAPKRRFNVRIGLHLGELVEEKGDLFGDAVNIAARIEPLADPGGIAMSGAIHAQIENQSPPAGVFLPPKRLKNIPEKMRIFLVPPPGKSRLWALRKRGMPGPIAPALVAAALALAGGWLYRRAHPGPVRIALLYINAAPDAPSQQMARAIDEQLSSQVAAAPGFQWVHRNGILDLFTQEGLTDLSQIENLERKACAVARKGGLEYSLVGRLASAKAGRWRLESKIICTKLLSVVGSFESEGPDAAGLARDQLRQLRQWANGYHLLASP